MAELISVESISTKILLIRGKRVMLDRDLADLYGVTTFNLNKAVKRNIERFRMTLCISLQNKRLKT
jgi:hypothetical protein